MWSFRKFMESDISEVSEYLKSISPPTDWQVKLFNKKDQTRSGVVGTFESITEIKAPDLNYTTVNTKIIKKNRRYGIFIPSLSSNFRTIHITRWQAIGYKKMVFIYLNDDGSIRAISSKEPDESIIWHGDVKRLIDLFDEYDAFKEISKSK